MKWLRDNLFSSWPSAIATCAILWMAWKLVPPLVDWALIDAVWRPTDSRACRQAAGGGACWAFIAEKHRFILFGTYPFEQHWRPALSSALLVTLWVFSGFRRFWNWKLIPIWSVGLLVIAVLMWGGLFGLTYVENERWGGARACR